MVAKRFALFIGLLSLSWVFMQIAIGLLRT